MRTFLILIILTGCAQQPVIVQQQEVITAPTAFITIPEPPVMPTSPERTNRDMYLWRVQYQAWACEVVYRFSETVRFYSLGQQSIDVPKDCER